MSQQKWKGIINNWINCYSIESNISKPIVSLESLLKIISHLRENLNLDESKSSILEAHNVEEFILEKYPHFKFESGTALASNIDDIYLAASLLLFFVCVNSKDVNIKSAMCSKLSVEDQEIILKFSKSLMERSSITYSDVHTAIKDACGINMPDIDKRRITVAETPPVLRSLHGEVRRLEAALDAERFDRNFLQEELARTNLKLEKLVKDKEQYKVDLINLKAQLSLCSGGDHNPPGLESGTELSVKLQQQLNDLEERLIRTQEMLDDAAEERDNFKIKVEELKQDRDKWISLSQQETARAEQLANDLESERNHMRFLEELISDLRQHNQLKGLDTSQLECDDIDCSTQNIPQNLSVCSEACTNVIEVQLSEEKAKVEALKQQIELLQRENEELQHTIEEKNKNHVTTIKEKDSIIKELENQFKEKTSLLESNMELLTQQLSEEKSLRQIVVEQNNMLLSQHTAMEEKLTNDFNDIEIKLVKEIEINQTILRDKECLLQQLVEEKLAKEVTEKEKENLGNDKILLEHDILEFRSKNETLMRQIEMLMEKQTALEELSTKYKETIEVINAEKIELNQKLTEEQISKDTLIEQKKRLEQMLHDYEDIQKVLTNENKLLFDEKEDLIKCVNKERSAYANLKAEKNELSMTLKKLGVQHTIELKNKEIEVKNAEEDVNQLHIKCQEQEKINNQLQDILSVALNKIKQDIKENTLSKECLQKLINHENVDTVIEKCSLLVDITYMLTSEIKQSYMVIKIEKANIEEKESALNNLKEEFNKQNIMLDILKKDYKDMTLSYEKHKMITKEVIRQKDEHVKSINKRLGELQHKIDKLETERDELTKKIEELLTEMTAAETRYKYEIEKLTQSLVEQEIKHTNVMKEKDVLNKELVEVISARDILNKLLLEEQATKDGILSEKTRLEDKYRQLVAEHDALINENVTTTQKLAEEKSLKKIVEEKLDELISQKSVNEEEFMKQIRNLQKKLLIETITTKNQSDDINRLTQQFAAEKADKELLNNEKQNILNDKDILTQHITKIQNEKEILTKHISELVEKLEILEQQCLKEKDLNNLFNNENIQLLTDLSEVKSSKDTLLSENLSLLAQIKYLKDDLVEHNTIQGLLLNDKESLEFEKERLMKSLDLEKSARDENENEKNHLSLEYNKLNEKYKTDIKIKEDEFNKVVDNFKQLEVKCKEQENINTQIQELLNDAIDKFKRGLQKVMLSDDCIQKVIAINNDNTGTQKCSLLSDMASILTLEIEKAQAAIKKEKAILEEKDSIVNNLEEQCVIQNMVLETLKKDYSNLEEQNKTQNVMLERANKEYNNLEEHFKKQNVILETLTKDYTNLQKQFDNQNHVLETVKQNYKDITMSYEKQELNTQEVISKKDEHVKNINEHLCVLQDNFDKLEVVRDELTKKIEELVTKMTDAERRYKEDKEKLTQSVVEQELKCTNIIKANGELNKQLDEEKSARNIILTEKSELEDKHKILVAEYDALKQENLTMAQKLAEEKGLKKIVEDKHNSLMSQNFVNEEGFRQQLENLKKNLAEKIASEQVMIADTDRLTQKLAEEKAAKELLITEKDNILTEKDLLTQNITKIQNEKEELIKQITDLVEKLEILEKQHSKENYLKDILNSEIEQLHKDLSEEKSYKNKLLQEKESLLANIEYLKDDLLEQKTIQQLLVNDKELLVVEKEGLVKSLQLEKSARDENENEKNQLALKYDDLKEKYTAFTKNKDVEFENIVANFRKLEMKYQEQDEVNIQMQSLLNVAVNKLKQDIEKNLLSEDYLKKINTIENSNQSTQKISLLVDIAHMLNSELEQAHINIRKEKDLIKEKDSIVINLEKQINDQNIMLQSLENDYKDIIMSYEKHKLTTKEVLRQRDEHVKYINEHLSDLQQKIDKLEIVRDELTKKIEVLVTEMTEAEVQYKDDKEKLTQSLVDQEIKFTNVMKDNEILNKQLVEETSARDILYNQLLEEQAAKDIVISEKRKLEEDYKILAVDHDEMLNENITVTKKLAEERSLKKLVEDKNTDLHSEHEINEEKFIKQLELLDKKLAKEMAKTKAMLEDTNRLTQQVAAEKAARELLISAKENILMEKNLLTQYVSKIKNEKEELNKHINVLAERVKILEQEHVRQKDLNDLFNNEKRQLLNDLSEEKSFKNILLTEKEALLAQIKYVNDELLEQKAIQELLVNEKESLVFEKEELVKSLQLEKSANDEKENEKNRLSFKYNELNEKYKADIKNKEHELNMVVENFKLLEVKYQDMLLLEKQNNELNTKVKELTESLEKTVENRNNLESQLNEKCTYILELEKKLQGLVDDVKTLHQEKFNLIVERDHYIVAARSLETSSHKNSGKLAEKELRDLHHQVDNTSDITHSSMESLKTISDLEKIIHDKNRTITMLQSDVTYLKNLIADSETKLLDATKELEISKENCHQLSSQLKKIVHQKNEELADLKKQVSKMSATETRASQIIRVSAKYQAIILRRIAEIKSSTVLKELKNYGNTSNSENELRRSLNAGSITMQDLENFLETTERHIKKCTEKQFILQKERDRLMEVNKINESELINLKKFLTELTVSYQTFSSVKDLYAQKLSRVISVQRTVRREILNLDGHITDACMLKLERGYAAVMQDLTECTMNLERWVERFIARTVSTEKIKQAFVVDNEQASLTSWSAKNTGLEVQLDELENSFQKLLEEVSQAHKGEGARDAESVTVMELRADYSDKLNRMKAKMKQLYVEQIAIFKEKQKEEIATLERELESARQKLAQSSQMYEEHIRGLTSELWTVGEKFLRQKDEAEWLRRRQHSGSLMSLQHVHSSGLVPKHEDNGRPSTALSLRSLPQNPKQEGRGLHMSDEEGEVFDNRFLKELATPRRESVAPGQRLSELQWRNSLCPPHLKSSYPAETQFVHTLDEDEIKAMGSQGTTSAVRQQRKEVGITAYKKPGPPTPSKQAGRLSATDSELRESLRVEAEPLPSRKTSTPSRIRSLFRSSKNNDTNEGTPRTRRLSNIFRKKI